MCDRLEPIMLKNLPIIPSRTSQIFIHYSYFIPVSSPCIPFLFYCVNSNVKMQTVTILTTYKN